MKPLLLTILAIFVLSGYSYASIEDQTPKEEKENTGSTTIPKDYMESYMDPEKEIATSFGIVRVDTSKAELKKMGFTKLRQRKYRREGREEWISYIENSFWSSDCIITFHLVDGKVKGWEQIWEIK